MQEAVGAKEVAEMSYHWFFDAQVFWAAFVALLGVTVNAISVRWKIQSEKKAISEEKRYQAETLARGFLAECATNLDNFEHYGADPLRAYIFFEPEFGLSIRQLYIGKFYEQNFSEVGVLGANSAGQLINAHNLTTTTLDALEGTRDRLIVAFEQPENEGAKSLTGAVGEKFQDIRTCWKAALEALAKDVETLQTYHEK